MGRTVSAAVAAVLVVLSATGCETRSRPPAGERPSAPAGGDALTRAEVVKTISDARWIDTSVGIDELRAVEIGGIKQWISVRGRDRRNPILLFVHGGPASTTMPAAWFFQTPWEEFYTVVQWDQRGAGKTEAANDPRQVNPTITVERMVEDAIELTAWLRRTYQKDKIFLMGHSWGTIIGVNVAQRHPEWLHAYIGMGQAVYGPDNERVGYEWALGEARKRNDTTAIRELEKLAPYPEPDGSVPVEEILVQRKWVIAFGGLTWGRKDFQYEQNVAKLAPEYTAADYAAMAKQDLTSLEQLLGPPNVLDFRKANVFKCPVFLMGGRYDYETPSEVAFAWFKTIQAPKKDFFWFERSAHMMTFEEPGKLLLHLARDIRPLAGELPSS